MKKFKYLIFILVAYFIISPIVNASSLSVAEHDIWFNGTSSDNKRPYDYYFVVPDAFNSLTIDSITDSISNTPSNNIGNYSTFGVHFYFASFEPLVHMTCADFTVTAYPYISGNDNYVYDLLNMKCNYVQRVSMLWKPDNTSLYAEYVYYISLTGEWKKKFFDGEAGISNYYRTQVEYIRFNFLHGNGYLFNARGPRSVGVRSFVLTSDYDSLNQSAVSDILKEQEQKQKEAEARIREEAQRALEQSRHQENLSFFDRVKLSLTDIWNSITSLPGNIWSFLSGGFSNIGTWFSNLTSSMGGFFVNLSTSLGNWFVNLPGAIWNGMGNAFNWLLDSLSDVGGFIVDLPGQIWDFIKSGFNWITDGLGSLGSFLINGIKSLFVPDGDWFSSWTLNLKNNFSDQLGFLTYPFTLIIDLLNRYLDLNTGSMVLNIPEIKEPFTGGTLISSNSINFNSYLSNPTINNLWNIYQSFVSVILIVSFINLCKNEYDFIVEGVRHNERSE